MKLDIVIPAYNEEAAIEAIAQRCLDARGRIVSDTAVDAVTITVVSDGSRDRTETLARQFEPDIKVIAYPDNRGYGAAIKTGFAAGNGDLVAFLDADGTCDPLFFAPLVNALLEKDASVAIGSRMTEQSKMPAVRKLGNRIWRTLINWTAQSHITDAASGMRVIRRDVLELLEPLPDGLHYTPTMSCRAALDARISMVEVPMTYEERTGASKLSVVQDGLRFLRTILDVSLTYQPFRIISVPGIVLLLVAVVLLMPVVTFYVQTRTVPEDKIYRLLAVLVAAAAGFQMFLVGLAGERVVEMVHPKKWAGGIFLRLLQRLAIQRNLRYLATFMFAGALALNTEGLVTYAITGHVLQHWSRAAVGGSMVLIAFQCVAAAVLDRTVRLLAYGRISERAAENGAQHIGHRTAGHGAT